MDRAKRFDAPLRHERGQARRAAPSASALSCTLATLAAAAVGVVFLLAAFLKAWNPASLQTSIEIYTGLTSGVAIKALAVGLIGTEGLLGAMLVLRVYPRWALAAVGVLLLLFVAVLGRAWSKGMMDDCGCFGQWTRSPGEALVEDLLLLAVVASSWWFQPGAAPPTRPRVLSAGVLALASLALTAWAGLAWPSYYVNHVGDAPFRTYYVTDLPFDLAHGQYVVGAFSTACPHCQEDAPLFNKLAEDRRLPKLAMLAFQNRETRDRFRTYFHLHFPIGHLSSHATSTLLSVRYPKFFLTRDGVIKYVWDDGVTPTPDRVLEAMRKIR